MIRTFYKTIAYACLCIFVLASCEQLNDNETTIKNADFAELCDIYQDTTNITGDLITKEMMLTENVQNKLPALFNKLFTHINNNDADSRYQLIRQYAKQQNQLEWECKAANDYYSTNFK